VWRGSGSCSLSGLSGLFGFSGFFGLFSWCAAQDKPNKLDKLFGVALRGSSESFNIHHLPLNIPPSPSSRPRLSRSIENLLYYALTFFEVTHGHVDDRVSYITERTRA
jgi:hypothetical protein